MPGSGARLARGREFLKRTFPMQIPNIQTGSPSGIHYECMASPRKLTRPIWHLPMSGTDACYSSNAARFVADTVDIEMSDLHERFLAFVPAGGLILDAGGGSGRDSKAFLERGFRVRALDASAEVARLAEALIGQPVDILTFDDLTDVACYDGIWACASLVHALIRRLELSRHQSCLLAGRSVRFCPTYALRSRLLTKSTWQWPSSRPLACD